MGDCTVTVVHELEGTFLGTLLGTDLECPEIIARLVLFLPRRTYY
jgi:hypothetical protein